MILDIQNNFPVKTDKIFELCSTHFCHKNNLLINCTKFNIKKVIFVA